jgi:hypothetical protein
VRGVAILLLGSSLSAAHARDPWAFEGESVHYTIRSTAEKKAATDLLKYMDLCFDTYRRFLNPAPDRLPRQKFTLVLYKNLEEYKARGGSGRYGHYDGKRLVGYCDPEQMLPTFAHEGVHQFTDICFPNFDRLPSWYSEGIAECIANNEVRQGKLYLCLKKGPVPKIRLYVVQEAIRDGRWVRLKDLLAADRKIFQDQWKLYYATSWLFCHFLLAYPKQEDPSRQIPEGKYKQVVVKFHNAMLDPKTKVDEALRLALVLDGKPLSLDELEKEFREYALSFEAERPAENR